MSDTQKRTRDKAKNLCLYRLSNMRSVFDKIKAMKQAKVKVETIHACRIPRKLQSWTVTPNTVYRG